ncbi:MAG: hypothetical protein D6830_02295 [Ignavibacteria bacterium]|nr:MAG: hypothetical protein D6830_02295 [Ignavibacteria bacterium]
MNYPKQILFLSGKYLFLFVSILFVFTSCKDTKVLPVKNSVGGVCLTFDDDYVKEWSKLSKLLKDHGATATFFVDHTSLMDTSTLNNLVQLHKDGFEIGLHSEHHIDFSKYTSKAELDSLIKNEIDEQIRLLSKYGIKAESFSYPYGLNTNLSDSLLLSKFRKIRDIADEQRHFYSMWFTNADEIDDVFYRFDSSGVIKALGIDTNFGISLDDIKKMFDRVKEENSVVVFYAHRPVVNASSEFEISYDYIRSLVEEAGKRGLKFYRFCDLN